MGVPVLLLLAQHGLLGVRGTVSRSLGPALGMLRGLRLWARIPRRTRVGHDETDTADSPSLTLRSEQNNLQNVFLKIKTVSRCEKFTW
jgi:hypothetical protein